MVSSSVISIISAFILLVGTNKCSSVGAFVVPNNCRRHGSTTSQVWGWGPDPVWSAGEIKSNDSANQSGECIAVTLTIPPETAQEYTIPGQYVQVRKDDDTKPLTLAIASSPDAENARFEFLIKKTDDNAWVTDGSIDISQVMGKGYPMKEELDGLKHDFPCQNILLFAAGSGIAPIRSAIESGELQTSGTRTARLYYGAKTEKDLCFVNKFPEWEKKGIQVVPVLSRPGDGWEGRTGYVQNALEEDGVPVPRNSGVLLCGMKGMTEAVTEILTKAGVISDRILTNF